MIDLINLSERVAVVTGGTRGIGLSCAEQLAAAGASVIVLGRQDLDKAEAIASSLNSRTGTNSLGLVADSRDPVAIQAVYNKVRETYGRLDILVNNAGVLDDALIGMITAEQVSDTMAINSIGPIHHLQAAARLMRKQGGSIINITSIIGRVGNPGQVVYAASKSAVIGMTYSAAKELASQNVRVNAVAPGFIDTDMIQHLSPEKYDERLRSIAMLRSGSPLDVANVVLFLASDLSTYVTGQVIGVDGGMLI